MDELVGAIANRKINTRLFHRPDQLEEQAEAAQVDPQQGSQAEPEIVRIETPSLEPEPNNDSQIEQEAKTPAPTQKTPEAPQTTADLIEAKTAPQKAKAEEDTTATKAPVEPDAPPEAEPEAEPEPPPEPDLGVFAALPERYQSHRLVLLARDPRWAFAYWDLDVNRFAHLLPNTEVAQLRLYDAPSGALVRQEAVQADRGRFYFQVHGGHSYLAAIVLVQKNGELEELARSGVIEVPPELASEPVPSKMVNMRVQVGVLQARDEVGNPPWLDAPVGPHPSLPAIHANSARRPRALSHAQVAPSPIPGLPADWAQGLTGVAVSKPSSHTNLK